MSQLRAVYIPRRWPSERLLGPTGKDVHRRISLHIMRNHGEQPEFFEIPFDEWSLLTKEFEGEWPWMAVGDDNRVGWIIAGVPVVVKREAA